MKRICFLTDSIFTIGGVQRVTAVIAKALAADYSITIVTLDKPEQKSTSLYGLDAIHIDYRFFSYPRTNGKKEYFCKAYSYLYRKYLPQNRFTSNLYAHSSFPREKRIALAQELVNGQYDIIIGVHAPLAIRLAACKSQLGNTKLIGWIHNSYQALFCQGSRYMGPELRKHCEWQLAKLHQTVVLCQYDAHQFHIPTRVIYNPLTIQPAPPSNGKNKKFLAVGRFAPRHKGFDILIEAFRLFALYNKDWNLDIVGDGQEKALYQEMITRYKLDKRITIHPFTNNIQSFYSAASAYVLSSRWEGMPLVLMEAMSHGLPVISSDLPVCKEVMGNFALYFENGNIEHLAQRLEEFTHMEWDVKSKEALSIAHQYSVSTIITQWKKLLEDK